MGERSLYKSVVVLILLISFVQLSVVQTASALVIEKSLDNIVRDSEDIITGTVTDKVSYWKDGNIFTNVTIYAKNHIKGKLDDKFVVTIRGGTVGNIRADVSDVPLFKKNEEVLVFLKDGKVVGWKQGKYAIDGGVVKGTNGDINDFIKGIKKILSTGPYGLAPHIYNITPGHGPAKASNLGGTASADDSTQVVINGSNFGFYNGNVEFWNLDIVAYNATIISWKDSEIVAKVPGRISSYKRPDGTGNVQIVTSDGIPSDNYGDFGVDYSYGGGKFNGDKIVYKVNQNNYDIADELSTIQSAADSWNNAGADFKFIYGGPTYKNKIALDGENSIIWTGYSTGTVATTTTWWYVSDENTVIESDVEFNNVDISWDNKGSLAKMDLQTVATHEFGHWMRLLDLYGSNDAKKVMYGYVNEGDIRRNLSAYDIDGIRSIYGSAGGAGGAGGSNGNILAYYRSLGQYVGVVETDDLLKAADNWRNNIIVPGFSVSLTTGQLLMLADEWRNS